MGCLLASIWLTQFGSVFSSPKHPAHYHARGRGWRERGWTVLLRVLIGVVAREGVTRTSMGENPRTVPPWWFSDSQHGCPALISAGLPQSPRLFASLGHLTRCLLPACSFLCQLCHFVWQSGITPWWCRALDVWLSCFHLMFGGLFVLSCAADMWVGDMFAFIKETQLLFLDLQWLQTSFSVTIMTKVFFQWGFALDNTSFIQAI